MSDMKRKLGEGYLDQFVSDANEVITFKFVRNEQELDNDANSFKPEYTHQFFGDSENIFGYIDLHVDICYTACRLLPYFSMKYREKVKPSNTGGVEPDNVYKIICDKMEFEINTDLDKFMSALEKESTFKPYGELIEAFIISGETYEVYKADMSVVGFRDYHRRMQTLILWSIDAASYIDQDDDRWDYFVLHKKDSDGLFPFLGYMTAYRYYAYPERTRPRISQMLILPMYRKRGLGSKLLESVCSSYAKDSQVLDITVEDPSEEFVRIRDRQDCKRCRNLPVYKDLTKGFLPSMAEEARKKFKINRRQARRVYEILRLQKTDTSDAAKYREYRLEVKKRLNAPFQREYLDLQKLKGTVPEEELKAASEAMPREQRLQRLEQMYKDTEAQYLRVIDGLDPK